MMQAGVYLRQDTEATLPELTEQHKIRLKEEELRGLESVHMAESETVCAAPGLNTLEPECVPAHSGVSDVHHTRTSLIKTEADQGSTPTGDLFKTESLDSTELGYVTRLHPDQIKTEADDGGYLQAEHTSELQDFTMKSDKMKCESSETLVSNLMKTVMNGACVDLNDQTEPWQCAGEPISNCENKESCDLLTQFGELNSHSHINNENNRTKIVQKNAKGHGNPINSQTLKVMNETLIINSRNNPSPLIFLQKNKIHMNKNGINTGKKVYKCTQCEKCFHKKSDLSRHLRIHTGENPNKCPQCEKCFDTKSGLNRHLRIYTGEKPYKCTQCEKCFNTKYGLNSHLRSHTGEKPYKCSQCEKWFHTIPVLNTHLRVHTGEKPYKCTQCEKWFRTKSNLNTHLRIHAGEKPYKCRHCGKCFSQKAHLDTHLRIHTGEKPYKCCHCGKCFSQKTSLENHLRIHTGEKPYQCTQCEKCFHTMSGLSSHLRIHTGKF